MPKPSELARRRYSRISEVTRVLRPEDPEFEVHVDNAIRKPYVEAIETRLRFTDPEQVANLIIGLSMEVRKRLKEVKP